MWLQKVITDYDGTTLLLIHSRSLQGHLGHVQLRVIQLQPCAVAEVPGVSTEQADRRPVTSHVNIRARFVHRVRAKTA